MSEEKKEKVITNRESKRHPVKLPKEDAIKQVDLFLDYYDIEPEIDAEDSTHRAQLLNSVQRLTKHVMKGRVEITENDKGDIEILQILKRPINDVSQLTYKVLGGVAKQEIKHTDDKDPMGKVYAIMGSLSEWPGRKIAQLKSVDMSAVECIGALLLVV